ncbi:unnamed protein product [Penicillium glandicola]
MPTYKRKCDTVASSIYTTEEKPSIEKWLEDTMEKIDKPVIELGLTMPEKRLDGLEQRPDMDKGLLDRAHKPDKIEDRIKTLKDSGDIFQERITSVQEQLSMRNSFQQYSGLKDRLAMHERLLEIANQQINAQQELIKNLFAAQASTSRQLALVTYKLSQQPEQCVQRPQVEEPEGQSNPGGATKSTDASDYVLISEDEATS